MILVDTGVLEFVDFLLWAGGDADLPLPEAPLFLDGVEEDREEDLSDLSVLDSLSVDSRRRLRDLCSDFARLLSSPSGGRFVPFS